MKQNYVFLSRTRRWSLIFSVLVGISTIAATTIYGYNIEDVFWIWLVTLILVLPLAIVPRIKCEENKLPGNLIQKNGHIGFIVSLIFYYLIVLFMSSNSVEIIHEDSTREFSLLRKLQSLLILTPIEALLLYYYWKLFFRQKYNIIPDNELIEDFIENNKVRNHNQTKFNKECYELISVNKIKEVLNLMKDYFRNTSKLKFQQLILLQNQYLRNAELSKLSLIEFNDKQINDNKVIMGLLEILENK